MTQAAQLARRLGTFDAVVIGLGSMIGAGVFSAFGPAAAAAGASLLIGLALAAAVAYCNAVASAQLAAQYPTSGGTYVYGRERLGEWWGFLAGWGFVIGKTASCAAMALTFASYAAPGGGWERRAVAAGAVAVLTGANLRGITRTAALARVLVAAAIVALLVVVGAILATGNVSRHGFAGLGGLAARWRFTACCSRRGCSSSPSLGTRGSPLSAKRCASRSGRSRARSRSPSRSSSSSTPSSGATALAAAGPSRLAAAATPLAAAAKIAGAAWAQPVVRVGAAVASLGALLALIAGVGRTTLAMARNGDLPRWLASVESHRSVPDHAELLLGAVVIALVLTTDLRGAIGFSSFGVLVYYTVANIAAFTQPAERRRWPRALNVAGCRCVRGARRVASARGDRRRRLGVRHRTGRARPRARCASPGLRRGHEMRPGGFEPPTNGLEGRRSSTELRAPDRHATARDG